MRRLLYIGLILGALTINGCASAPARITSNYVSQNAAVFLITEAQADRILVDAMNLEFGNSPIVRVEHPNRGYQATISFLLDSHQIVATMVPSKVHSGDGSIRDGYAFDVRHTGTMPLSGMARAGRLRERLSRAAEALSPSVPAVR